jgi:hypothetical protein
MFFDGGGPHGISHIFGQGNLWYSAESGSALVAPPDFGNLDADESMAEGVEYDVQRESCAGTVALGFHLKGNAASGVERKIQTLNVLFRWVAY